MPLDRTLLDLLVCPDTKQPLLEAPADVLKRLNIQAEGGTLLSRSGTVLRPPILAGLLRQDGRVFFPIIDEIPVLLSDEAVEIAE